MIIVEIVSQWHVLLIEPVVACFISADKQYGGPPGIEGVEDPDGPASTLRSKLAHSPVARSPYVRGIGVRQIGAVLHKQLDSGGHGVLLTLRKFLPPLSKLVRVLDLPSHGDIIFPVRNLTQEATGHLGDGPIWRYARARERLLLFDRGADRLGERAGAAGYRGAGLVLTDGDGGLACTVY